MTRKNLVLLLAIITFTCLGFIAQASYFSEQIDALKAQNEVLIENEEARRQQVQGLEDWVSALSQQVETKQQVLFEEEEILAKLLWCEARGMSWEGQVYTCSAILNYCEYQGISIEEASHNPQMFEPAPYVDSATPTPTQYEVIYYVLDGGRIPDICYFRTDHYHSFGTPVCEVDGHYFSKP